MARCNCPGRGSAAINCAPRSRFATASRWCWNWPRARRRSLENTGPQSDSRVRSDQRRAPHVRTAVGAVARTESRAHARGDRARKMECLLGCAADGSRPRRHESGSAAQAGRDPPSLGQVPRHRLPGENRRRAHRGHVSRPRSGNLFRRPAIHGLSRHQPAAAGGHRQDQRALGGLQICRRPERLRHRRRHPGGLARYGARLAAVRLRRRSQSEAVGLQARNRLGDSRNGRRHRWRFCRRRTNFSSRARSKPTSATCTTARTARPRSRIGVRQPDRGGGRQALGRFGRSLDAARRRIARAT